MDTAGATKVRPYGMPPSTLARTQSLSNFSSRSINARALYPAFDIEVEMARSLITSDPDARPEHFRNLFEECLFVFMVMMATASTTFLQGVVVINTATIAKDLRMSPVQVTWISAALGYGCNDQSSPFRAANGLQSRKRLFHASLWQDCGPVWTQASTPHRYGIPQHHISRDRFCSQSNWLECALWLSRPWHSGHLSASHRHAVRHIPRRPETEQGSRCSRHWKPDRLHIGKLLVRACYQILFLEGFIRRHRDFLRNLDCVFFLDNAFDPQNRFTA